MGNSKAMRYADNSVAPLAISGGDVKGESAAPIDGRADACYSDIWRDVEGDGFWKFRRFSLAQGVNIPQPSPTGWVRIGERPAA